MTIRTTDVLVRGIANKIKASDDLTPFILAANTLVTRHCVTATSTATDLELIERWLAAHFYHVDKERTDSDKAGPVSRNKRSKTDMALSLTHYGQMAMTLDESGALARLNQQVITGKGGRPSITWLGITTTTWPPTRV